MPKPAATPAVNGCFGNSARLGFDDARLQRPGHLGIAVMVTPSAPASRRRGKRHTPGQVAPWALLPCAVSDFFGSS